MVWHFVLAVLATSTVIHYSYKIYLSSKSKSAPYLRNRLLKYIGNFSFDNLLTVENVPKEIQEKRLNGYNKLKAYFQPANDQDGSRSAGLEKLSDERFGLSACVPFYFKKQIDQELDGSLWVEWTKGPLVGSNKLLKDNSNKVEELYDISGSFGLNVAGHETFKKFLKEANDQGNSKANQIALGSLSDTLIQNINILSQISGQEAVSFHNSGTEAVMSAIRLAKFNTQRPYVIVFKGAYHGWWDAVLQGSTTAHNGILTLKEAVEESLSYIEYEGLKIAAVIVNPMQAFDPNSYMPIDAMMVNGKERTYKVGETNLDYSAQLKGYKAWLEKLRIICSDLGIALIFDEVYSGFRISRYGAQELFNVQADLVCYGKSVGGGLPVGVVCGKKSLMKKSDPEHLFRRADVLGTFCAAPTVMASMNAFLNWVTQPSTKDLYIQKHALFDTWAAGLNKRFAENNVPVRVSHWHSLLCFQYISKSHYHWLFQYYLRKNGLYLAWTGTGRCLLSLDYDEASLQQVSDRIINAANEMNNDGWWYNSNKDGSIVDLKWNVVKGLLWSSLVLPVRDYWLEIEMHKRIDDEVSHRHPVNQMFHVISSIITLSTYGLFAYGYWGVAIMLNLLSQTIRQSGHFFFERSPPGAERAKIGFDTQVKKIMCVIGAVLYVLAMHYEPVAELFLLKHLMHNPYTFEFLARFLILYFGATFVSKACFIFHKANLRLSILWLTKIVTDPFTDITIYGGSFKRVYYRYFAGNHHVKAN